MSKNPVTLKIHRRHKITDLKLRCFGSLGNSTEARFDDITKGKMYIDGTSCKSGSRGRFCVVNF
jgi:hypothetical protein